MNELDIISIPEVKLQRHIHRMISDPAKVRRTSSGKRLQILSPGEINVHGGPDFLDSAILLEGLVNVGDIEFHKKASDWNNHNHSNNRDYDNVILHIVLKDNIELNQHKFETLVIDEQELVQAIQKKQDVISDKIDTCSLEDLQHFALIRLLRKSAEIQSILNKKKIEDTLYTIVSSFIARYNSRRKRPVYSHQNFDDILENLKTSKALEFLVELGKEQKISIPDTLHVLMKTKFAQEGAHLRREILLNCILPLAICLANDEARISLFLWYWSTPALRSYGILTRKFKNLPQNFLWEQQGMLEYLKEYGRHPNIVREALKSYGFAEVLSFYRLGKSPFK